MGNKKSVIILGAGGHAQVVADIFLLEEKYTIVGFLDDDQALHNQTIMDIPVLGSMDQLGDFQHEHIFIAIGDNKIRAALFSKLAQAGESIINAIHPRSIISPSVQIGTGVLICAGVIINPGTVIEDNAILNTGCIVDHHNIIQKHVHLAPGCKLGGDVSVGTGSLVGIGATVMPQLEIGKWSEVGAGAVVTKNIKDDITVIGVPARDINEGQG